MIDPVESGAFATEQRRRIVVTKLWQASVVGLAVLVMAAGASYVRTAAGNNGSAEQKAAPSALSHIELTRAEKALAPGKRATVAATAPATLDIVPASVIETKSVFFFGTGDNSAGFYAERPIP
jgi:hypothetical protein